LVALGSGSCGGTIEEGVGSRDASLPPAADARRVESGNETVSLLSPGADAAVSRDAPLEAWPDEFATYVPDGTVPPDCSAEAGVVVVLDGGLYPSCADSHCGPGEVCVNTYDIDGGAIGLCASVPQECLCAPTCECLETWFCEATACTAQPGIIAITCKSLPLLPP
jgi:hypothetical protein